MWTYEKPRHSLIEAGRLGLMVAGVALVALTALALQAVRPGALRERPRCYWIGPPLTHYQPMLLRRGFLDCASTQCQVTVHPFADAGWVCFFPSPQEPGT